MKNRFCGVCGEAAHTTKSKFLVFSDRFLENPEAILTQGDGVEVRVRVDCGVMLGVTGVRVRVG
jgi:hypothetical protein